MANEDSILISTKKILGIAEADDSFDLDIVTHINTSFFTLTQLGLGPAQGFMVADETTTWQQFTGGAINLQAVKTYIYLKVRMYFDRPETNHHLTAMKEQISELEYRLQVEREAGAWVAP